jgi:hypothetical protein
MATRYVVAVRRDQRRTAPRDWLEQLARIDGVELLGVTAGRAQIEVDEQALGRLRSELGRYLHIEPVIRHRPA